MTFIPERKLITSVTNAVNAEVTTTEDHGYSSGDVVRVFVPKAYGMELYNQANITVTSDTTFTTNLDTSNQLPFVQPVFTVNGPGFTDAQVIPITCGAEDNIS